MNKKTLIFGEGEIIELESSEIGGTLRYLNEEGLLIAPRLYCK